MAEAFSVPDFSYSQDLQAPIMVVGDSLAARIRGRATAEATGLRVLQDVECDTALGRLEEQPHLSALWVELEGAPSEATRRLLHRADREARANRYGVVVSGRLANIDQIWSELSGEGRLDLLIDGSDAERVASITMACQDGAAASVRDVASDASAARLRQLSEEVSRIAAALSRLSTTPSEGPLSQDTLAPPREDVPNVSAEALRAIIRARRARASYFPADLFADPAWDMLLDLLQAELVQHRVPVSSLCIAAAVPATTALRWIKSMTESGLLLRRDDPHDGRRVFIEMAPATSAALRRYFHDTRMAAV